MYILKTQKTLNLPFENGLLKWYRQSALRSLAGSLDRRVVDLAIQPRPIVLGEVHLLN